MGWRDGYSAGAIHNGFSSASGLVHGLDAFWGVLDGQIDAFIVVCHVDQLNVFILLIFLTFVIFILIVLILVNVLAALILVIVLIRLIVLVLFSVPSVLIFLIVLVVLIIFDDAVVPT